MQTAVRPRRDFVFLVVTPPSRCVFTYHSMPVLVKHGGRLLSEHMGVLRAIQIWQHSGANP